MPVPRDHPWRRRRLRGPPEGFYSDPEPPPDVLELRDGEGGSVLVELRMGGVPGARSGLCGYYSESDLVRRKLVGISSTGLSRYCRESGGWRLPGWWERPPIPK